MQDSPFKQLPLALPEPPPYNLNLTLQRMKEQEEKKAILLESDMEAMLKWLKQIALPTRGGKRYL